MENEHVIIIALLLVIFLVNLNRKSPSPCDRPELQGFLPDHIRSREDIPTAAHIRSRIGLAVPNTPQAFGTPQALEPQQAVVSQRIRHRETDERPGQGFNLQRVQNRDHNMYHSQFVRHHLKNDHRQQMLQNLEGDGSADSAGAPY